MGRFIYPIAVLKKPLFSVCPLPPQIKYWLLNKTKIHYIPSDYVEGTSLSLNNSGRFPLIDFNLMGNSIQDGEPTSENEQPVNSVGDNVNLCNYNSANKYVASNGAIINGDNRYIGLSEKIEVEPNTTYTITFIGYENYSSLYIGEWDSSEDWIARTTINKLTFTTSANTKYIFPYLYNGDAPFSTTNTKVKFEQGTQASPYSPYGMGCASITKTNEDNTESKTYIIPTQQPMRSIGEVRDDFVKQNGVWYERHNLIHDILDGSNTQDVGYSSFSNCIRYINSNIADINSQQIGILSNKAKGITLQSFNLGNNGIVQNNTNNRILLRFDGVENYNTEALIRQYFSGNNYDIYYIAAEPILLPCTNEQFAILDEIMKDPLYEGQTNFFSLDTIAPYLKVKYYMAESGE